MSRVPRSSITILASVFSIMLAFLPHQALSTPHWYLLEDQLAPAPWPQFILCGYSNNNPLQTKEASRGWYESILTQQRIIAEQIETLRTEFNQNLLNTQELLDGMSSLFERTDRLYIRWKKLGWPQDEETAFRPFSDAILIGRKDLAVGRSINYLRLSLINFFLGYVDSNSALLDTAEGQVALSRVWRTRSLLFLKGLDS